MDSAVGVGDVGAADGEGVTVVVCMSHGGLMAWVLLVLVLGAACVWVVGGSGRATRGWCLAARLVVLVVPVVSGVGLFLSAVLGSVVVGVASVVVEGVDALGGWWCRRVAAVGGAGDDVGEGAAGRAVGVCAAGDAEDAAVVGDTLVDSGVLTVGTGPRHSWRRFPWALLAGLLALAPLVSLMSMVSYQVVSLWWLSVMPPVRSLRALLWFTASLMLLMLLVVGVGLCVGGQWPVFGGGHWLVSVAPSGSVCSRWRGLLVMLLVRVVQAMPRVASWARVVLVASVVWVPLVTAWWMAPCGWFGGEGVVVDGSRRVSSPPLAGAWWFVGSLVVVALVSSGGGGCRWRR